jgi:cytosine/adenosine deaminase-related metal-dependent hydrolase
MSHAHRPFLSQMTSKQSTSLGKILTPGFIDSHKYGWQTVFKTLASHTSVVKYFAR